MFFQTFNKDVQTGIIKQINIFVEKVSRSGDNHTVAEMGDEVQRFYSNMNQMITTQLPYMGKIFESSLIL